MSFDRNILYLSAFGKTVNNAVSGGAVEGILKEIAESKNPMVAPWTSATPLSGELLQASLNALLQNDTNLLSAYPDSYLKPTYNSTSYTNIQQFSYAPAGAGQTVASGDDGWTNSVMVSAYVGTVGNGDTSAVMLGSLVPSYPFQQGKVWNYGVFGVEDGEPTWFPVSKQFLESQRYNEYAIDISNKIVRTTINDNTYFVLGNFEKFVNGGDISTSKFTITVPPLRYETVNSEDYTTSTAGIIARLYCSAAAGNSIELGRALAGFSTKDATTNEFTIICSGVPVSADSKLVLSHIGKGLALKILSACEPTVSHLNKIIIREG